MKFKFTFILTLFVLSTAIAQKQNTIEWGQPKKGYDGIASLNFNGASLSNGLPYFTKTLSGKYISNAEINNATYVLLDEKEVKRIPSNFDQNQIRISTSQGKARNEWISEISFIPLRKNEGKWEKLVSFELKMVTSTPPMSKTTGYDWNTTSALKSGTFYKIAVTGTSLYKIDYDFIQNTLGVNPSTLNPKNIKLYGNGGAMLPQRNTETWYDDPDENAIFVSGQSDNSFDNNDYILFYAQGAVKWTLSSDSINFEHEKNRYSDTTYFFLNLNGSTAGKRVSQATLASGATTTITKYNAYDVYERDDENVVISGRNWYENKFDFELTRDYSFNTPGILSPGLTISTRLGAVSQSATSFQVLANNNNLGVVPLSKYNDPSYPTVKVKTNTWDSIATSSNSQKITLSYNKGSSSASLGYNDYIRINYLRTLQLYDNQTRFRSIASLDHAVSQFSVANTSSSVRIWDITHLTNIQSIAYSQSGSTSSFSVETDTIREFLVFSGSNFPAPSLKGAVQNQKLHELPTPDLLIVTHDLFKSEALRLATHREEIDGLDVEVVSIDEVYNEFSSGMEDPTAIRNMCKMFYDRNADKFKYLLLMGDCSYDYKNRISKNTDFVPVYESRDSESPITSHSSDDYFAFLDDGEGFWCANCSTKELQDIGVGRIPAKTIEEAKGVVDKIIHYDTQNENFDECSDATSYKSGKWKNEIVVISDDSDGNRHMQSAELIYDEMQAFPQFHVDKIYIDAYEQFSGAGGQTAPDVKLEINRKMERGALIFNYSGHGGELGLSHEGVISVDQIRNWDNFDNMPLMFTATCEFGRYDDPERTSAGEYTLLNDKGGVVGIVTTTRPVYSSQNNSINKAFFASVFDPIDSSSNEMPRLGDVMRKAKNVSASSNNVNNRNFALLGDPSMRLAYPQENVVLTKINDSIVNAPTTDTISALQKVTMKGEIRNNNNQRINDFNGVIEVSIYDKLSTYRTLGDEKGFPQNFDERDTKIFEGLASVNNGVFTFSFIVPKDIKYQFGHGKAIFYAASDNLNIDANGADQTFMVGGTDPNAENDQTPPEINLFMDDESFVFGGTTSASPTLLAKLFDDHGINTTGVGIGHEISAIVDGKSDNTLVLNDFYTSELDDYQKGVVKYPFENMTIGNHRLTLKAWDTYNNSNEEYIEFMVVDDADIALTHILNYPNPFTTSTSFHFDHNRFCDDLQVMIQIYTVSGKLVKTIQQNYAHAPAHISDINWDGRDDFGKNIGRGVYVYKVKVRSLTDNAQVQEYQKLVILK